MKADKSKPNKPVGRPRTSVPEKEQLIELGKDLVKWATEPTDELRFQFSQWYCGVHGYIAKDWTHMLEKEEFRAYYEKAKDGIARRYIDGTIHPSIAQRFLRIYFPLLKAEENEKIEFEAKVKANLTVSEASNLITLLQKLQAGDITQK